MGLTATGLACSDATLDSGLSVTVVVDAPLTPARTGHEVTFTTDLGVVVHLTTAYLSSESAELLPCASAGASLSTTLKTLFAIPSAYAHSTGSPTRLGTPVVEDLLRTTGSSPLGTMAPPPAKYCTLRYSVGAADDDAVGLPTDGSMMGKSLHLEGDYALTAGSASAPLTVDSTEAFDRDLTFDALDLSAAGAHIATIAVDKAMEHWFDGIDFTTTTDDARSRAVLSHVRDSLTVSRR